jgi:hypothetical protein
MAGKTKNPDQTRLVAAEWRQYSLPQVNYRKTMPSGKDTPIEMIRAIPGCARRSLVQDKRRADASIIQVEQYSRRNSDSTLKM